MCETCVPILREISVVTGAPAIVMTAKCANCGRDMCANEVNAYVNNVATIRLCLTCRWSGGGCQDEAHFSGSECVTYQHFSALNGKIDELQEEMELGKINYRRLCRVRDSLRAELAARDEKRCETCGHYRSWGRLQILKCYFLGIGVSGAIRKNPNFHCSEWRARNA